MSEIIPLIEASGQAQQSAVRGTQAARVMMMLGDFAFSIDNTACNQFVREASWRWSEQERIGKPQTGFCRVAATVIKTGR